MAKKRKNAGNTGKTATAKPVAAASPGRPEYGWLSKAVAAEAFGVQPLAFDRTYRRFAGPNQIRVLDGRCYFHLRPILESWAVSAKPAPADAEPDPLLGGSMDSPALERYRTARAKMAEMDCQEREAKLIPAAQVEEAFAIMAQEMRRAGETLALQFGNDAGKIVGEAIDAMERQWARFQESVKTV